MCSCPVLHMCLCFCLVWAHGFCLSFLCAICSHVNCLDPTHLVTWLLVNLPHLSFLVTLLICSLYNLLVFAVLCQFIIDVTLVVSCPALPCPALPCLLACQLSCFTLRCSFCFFVCYCFVLFFSKIKAHYPEQPSPRLIPSPQPWQIVIIIIIKPYLFVQSWLHNILQFHHVVVWIKGLYIL